LSAVGAILVATLRHTGIRALLDDRNLGRREVEQGVDAGVQVGLHADDRIGALLVFSAAGLEPFFPMSVKRT
jgi:hypothetical protein